MTGLALDYRGILGSFERVPTEVSRQVETLLSAALVGRRYLLGRNQHSLAIFRAIEIDGFVDDFSEIGAKWQGKPVIKISDLESCDAVVNCSMSISPVSALARLKASPSTTVLNYSDLCRARPDLFVLPDFVQATRKDFQENEAKLVRLYESLADDQSRAVMLAVTGYRLTGDPTYMKDFQVRFSEQYFEDFLDLNEIVFVDAGGFDGDTAEEFCRRYPAYKKIFLFEPSPRNIEAAKKRLLRYPRIEFVQLGLSDAVGRLWFNPNAGSASAVSTGGAEKIDVTTLDHYIDDRVTFIKMDLEGWELQALQGSARHVAEDHPALAISVYHCPSDFWRIFEYVMSIRDDYDVYLRHYTEGWSETVMFFVPRRLRTKFHH